MAASVNPPGGGGDMYDEPLAALPARLRPGRAWYLVALAVVVAGVAWLLIGLGALNGQINSFQRVALPGNGEITLTHSGSYVIYYEGPGAASGNAPDFTVQMWPLSASAAVQSITPSSGSGSVSFGSHADAAVLNLTIARPGRFLLRASAPAAPAGSRLAVGASIEGFITRVVFPFIALFLVGFAAAIVILFIRRSRAARGRRQALARVAVQYGMQYSDEAPYDLLTQDFRLFRQGDGRGCEHVLSGRWQDLPVTEADYWYYKRTSDGQGGGGRSYRSFSIVIAELAATVPYVWVRKETTFTKLAGHLGFHDIQFGYEDFDRQFKVTASDKEFVAKLIDPAMIQWLLSTGGQFAFEIQGSRLLVSCRPLPATGLGPLFDTAKGFTDHIPELVWADYKTS
jgi:hypothetical protein